MKKTLSLLLFAFMAIAVNAQYKPTVSILGDSYSTFEGFIQPSSNEMWYYAKNAKSKTDVNDVRQTWWWQVCNDGNYRLCRNNSYSGATICYVGYDGNDYSERSFITRLDNICCPDILLIFGATNDSWAGSPIGNYKYSEWTKADFYSFRPAMAYLINHAQLRYPNTRVYFILNSELKDEINSSCLEICRHYGIKCIQLKDIKKQSGHPSVEGMKAIASQILEVLKTDEK